MVKEFKNVSVNYEADALVEINKKQYKIHGCVDGEDILVETEGKYPYLVKVIKPSPNRVKNGCQYQKECGGCQFMHISYEYETKLKKDYLNELFKGINSIPEVELISTYEPLNYRNKSQMAYKLSKQKNVVCGFYEEYSHRLVPVKDCMLQAKAANQVIEALNLALSKNKIKPYDEKTKQGTIRHVFVRYGYQTKQLMLVIVTNGEMFPGRNNVIKDLMKMNLNITTIVQNYNPRDTSIVLGDRNKVLYGPGFIYEEVGGFKFKISPNSFFQINSLGMKKLYTLAINNAGIKDTDTVLDAYCGVGTISLFASKHAKHVVGVELNSQAINDAKLNAKINNVKNIDFICDDATNFITHQAQNRNQVDVLIMDPPREGSTKQFINAVSYLKPRTVVYVSCDPITLKRDLYLFFENDYIVKSITGVDMFPKTKHIECVVRLDLKDPKNV